MISFFLHHNTAIDLWHLVYTLSVQSFRCYATQRKTVSASPLLITGPNGAGKTSLLEALSLLTPGKGLRGAAFEDLQHHAENHASSCTQDQDPTFDPPWRVALDIQTATGLLSLETRMQDGTRKVWVNGAMLKTHLQMRHWLNVVWPMMLHNDTASQRRTYLNRLTFTLDMDYGALWLRYEKALRQRNILLQQGERNPTWYDSIEKVLSDTARLLFDKRREALWRVTSAMQHSTTPFPQPVCLMEGEAENSLIHDATGADYCRILRQNRALDGLKKTTSFGLHKTRFAWIHPHGREYALCSTGEQKGLLLSVALGVFRTALETQPYCEHFLLLDEGMAHLDGDRQRWLWQELCRLSELSGKIMVTGIHWDDAIPHTIEHWPLV